jgi:predicted nucleic acid-binding protein
MPFVLDASVTLAWSFKDEPSEYADRVLGSLARDTALVPSLWILEVTNGLLVAERRSRLSEADLARAFEIIANLSVKVDEIYQDEAFGPVADLARQQNLTAYDAAYLYLAMRDGVALATQDNDLRAAAQSVGVELFE